MFFPQRCLDEREEKYKSVTANIQESLKKSVPVRQTKLAYVDVKPMKSLKNVSLIFHSFAITIKNTVETIGNQAKYGTTDGQRTARRSGTTSIKHGTPKSESYLQAESCATHAENVEVYSTNAL